MINLGIQCSLPRILALGVFDRDRRWIDGDLTLSIIHNKRQYNSDELATLQCHVLDLTDVFTIGILNIHSE